MQTIALGSRGRFAETFTDLTGVTGTPADPTTVTVKLRDPFGTETSYTLAAGQVVRDALGLYHFDSPVFTVAGEWVVRWVGAGAIVAAHEYVFRVEKSAFTAP